MSDRYSNHVLGAGNDADTAARLGTAIAEPFTIARDQSGLSVRAVMVPEGFTLEPLERFEARPTSRRGAASFLSVESLAQYVAAHRTAGTAIAFNAGTMAEGQVVTLPALYAVLDYHAPNMEEGAHDAPGWGRHTAALVFRTSRQLAAWLAICARPRTQLELAELVEERIADIADPPGADLHELIRTFTISKVVNFSAAHNLGTGTVDLVYSEADEAASKSKTIKVPEVFTLAIPIFEGDDRVALAVRFRYKLTNDAKLSITLKIRQLEDAIEAAVAARVAAVEKLTGIKPYHGSIPSNIAPIGL